MDSFTEAKVRIYSRVDRGGDAVHCVYSGVSIPLVEDGEDTFAPDPGAGAQVEHTWASKAEWVDEDYHFARDSIPGADLHHLCVALRGLNASN